MIQKFRFTVFLIVMFFGYAFSQIKFSNVKGFSGPNDIFVSGNVIDASGNVFVTGHFDSIIDFDAGPGSYTLQSKGRYDIFVARYNPLGALDWVKQIGGNGDDRVNSISINNFDKIYICGAFTGVADFDPGPDSTLFTAAAGYDAFVCQLNTSGDLIWARHFSGTQDVIANDAAPDNKGSIYVTGAFKGTADFDPGMNTINHISAGLDDAFFLKLDQNGNYVWSKRYGNTGSDGGSAVAASSLINVYMAGWFSGSIKLFETPEEYTASGQKDIFLLKVNDTNGNTLAGKTIGGPGTEKVEDMTVDVHDELYMTGYFESTVDFDVSPDKELYLSSSGSEDIFVAKLGKIAEFDYFWVRSMGGPSQDNGRAIAVYGNSIFVTGFFSESADFDPGEYPYTISSKGNSDIFISQLDQYGNFVCAAGVGGPGADIGEGIAIKSDMQLHIAGVHSGYTSSPPDFDPGVGTETLTATGTYNGFLAKYESCRNTVDLQNFEIQRFTLIPNPTDGRVRVELPENNNLQVLVLNATGSVILRPIILGTSIDLDLQSQPAGLYIIKIEHSDSWQAVKLVKY